MEWLVLRLHRKAVARFGPLTADLSDWIRLYKELLSRDKELSNQIKRMKLEGKEFNRRIAELSREFQSTRISIEQMSKSVSDV